MLPSNFDYIDTMIENYLKDKAECEYIHSQVESTKKHIIGYVFKHSIYGLIHESNEMQRLLRRNYWLDVFNKSNLEDIISSKEKQRIIDYIYGTELLPEFNKDNVISTVQGWIGESHKMFSEKVNSVFERLSNDHITNKPHGFTKKIIFKNLVDYVFSPGQFNLYTFKGYGLDAIHDLRTSIQVLYRLPISSRRDTELMLRTINERNEYTSFDNDAFKVKVFMNGNAHIELNPHVAIKLNCELAKLFPTAIPPKHRTKSEEIVEYTFDYVHLSENTKELLRNFIIYGDYNHAMNTVTHRKHFNLTNELKDIFKFLNIIQVTPKEFVSENNIVEMIRHIIVNGIVDYKSNQFYPTPSIIVDDIVEYVGDYTDKNLLEPSAGRGNIADRFHGIHCIEKEDFNVTILKEKHKNVVKGDFLFYTCKKDTDKYDFILMNPPYNKKQWKTHVNHAITLLKPGGKIYAVLPDGKEDSFDNCTKLKVYKNEFENTSITTALYEIY